MTVTTQAGDEVSRYYRDNITEGFVVVFVHRTRGTHRARRLLDDGCDHAAAGAANVRWLWRRHLGRG